ncbi:hypothetical protein [Desulfocurvus vexinensis]|uniref:hypothetical protein n=1 Tax=Desulfocurvus vexinensis TaxID=399548 RepID=UPI0004AD7419|nr:hypothetical protein [Desulfocurvus vexinensis]
MDDIDLTRTCPHCGQPLKPWLGPPETMWGVLLVCPSNQCPLFQSSNDCVTEFNPESKIGFRYAEDPANDYKSFNLAAYCGETFMDLTRASE